MPQLHREPILNHAMRRAGQQLSRINWNKFASQRARAGAHDRCQNGRGPHPCCCLPSCNAGRASGKELKATSCVMPEALQRSPLVRMVSANSCLHSLSLQSFALSLHLVAAAHAHVVSSQLIDAQSAGSTAKPLGDLPNSPWNCTTLTTPQAIMAKVTRASGPVCAVLPHRCSPQQQQSSAPCKDMTKNGMPGPPCCRQCKAEPCLPPI